MTALRDEGQKERVQENKSIVSPCPPVSLSHCPRVLVLGLGNPILGDDGVGWRVAELCAERIKMHPQLANTATTMEFDSHSGGGLSLAERLVGYDRVILIDAISAGIQPLGSVMCFPLEALTNPGSVHTSSAHDTSLVTALELTRRLGARVPETVSVVAVRAQNLYEFSEELSPAVQTAVPEAVERVLDQLAAWTQMPQGRKGGNVVSPELLRRYPFFCCLDESQQKAIALIAEDVLLEKGVTLFEEGDPADIFYLLLEGGVDLFYPASRDLHDLLLVAEINQGEPFSISALIEPHVLTATAKTTASSRILKVDAKGLRALCEVDSKMGYALMRQAAMAAMERLHFARVQLAAARA